MGRVGDDDAVMGGVESRDRRMGFAVEQLINSMLSDSGGVDIVRAYVVVVPTLSLVTMLAAYIPARRASRIAPTQALRYAVRELRFGDVVCVAQRVNAIHSFKCC